MEAVPRRIFSRKLHWNLNENKLNNDHLATIVTVTSINAFSDSQLTSMESLSTFIW
jgi:hypothetical protein